MKFKIVFYLFLFVCIILLFQLINTNKILNHQDNLIQSQKSQQLSLKDSLSNLKKKLSVNKYFTLDQDNQTSEAIKKELLSYNIDGNLKELIQFLPEGERFLIDNIQLVNTDWILIGFRSVNIEGQAFLTYQKTARGFEFKALKSIINSF